MTSTNKKTTTTDTRKLTDYAKVRGTTRRKVFVGELRELGMWLNSAPRWNGSGWGYGTTEVWLAGGGSVGAYECSGRGIGYAEVQEWAIESALKLDVATNVKLAADATNTKRVAFGLSCLEGE